MSNDPKPILDLGHFLWTFCLKIVNRRILFIYFYLFSNISKCAHTNLNLKLKIKLDKI